MDLNSVCIVGRLTRDPEIRPVGEDRKVASFSVAVDRAGDSFETGFFSCETWGQSAEYVEKYVRKGNIVAITGTLRHHKWESEDGPRSQVIISATRVSSAPSGDKSSEEETVEVAPAKAKGDPFAE